MRRSRTPSLISSNVGVGRRANRLSFLRNSVCGQTKPAVFDPQMARFTRLAFRIPRRSNPAVILAAGRYRLDSVSWHSIQCPGVLEPNPLTGESIFSARISFLNNLYAGSYP